MIYDQVGLHEFKSHHEESQATRDMTPIAVICVGELALLRLKVVVACLIDIVIKYEVEGSTEMLEANLVSIYEAEVSGLVWVNGINIHVRGLGEGGRIVAHKTPGEGADLTQTRPETSAS